MAAEPAFMEKLVALCKRRGFIFQSSEIYGGIGGFWDYGPLGVELKRNIKEAWWHDMVVCPPDGPDSRELTMVGVDCSIIMNRRVWEASGHATGFADPMVSCRTEGCKGLFREDQLIGTRCPLKPSKAVGEFEKCDLTEPRAFNLMFESHAGAIQSEENKVYLRPETAQGIFCNYKNVLDTSRVKVPFGIAQVGKAFRNEINPRNYTFRSREFEQMEIEFFCRSSAEQQPGEPTDLDWYQFWRRTRFDWYVGLGLRSDKLRLRDQGPEELAHYSKACADIEYLFPFSDEFQELEGVAHRGCFDLTQHQAHSGADLHYFDEEAWSAFLAERKARGEPELAKEQKAEIAGKPPYRFLPTVIEPSAGADRATLAFLCEAYTEDQKPDAKGVMQTRVYMRFHPRLAPIKAAFLPLVNKEGMPELAQKLYREARRHFNVQYDDKGAIGRRYYRQDEAGTPFCITIDGETVRGASAAEGGCGPSGCGPGGCGPDDHGPGDRGSSGPQPPSAAPSSQPASAAAGTVTIRHRDTLEQVRVHHTRVLDWLRERLG